MDPSTFLRGDVNVQYRAATTPGSSPGIPLSITADPLPLDTDPTTGAATEFLIRFAPNSGVGSYSYTISPTVRDEIQSVVATNLYYAAQTVANLPTIPPVIARRRRQHGYPG